MIEWHQGIDDPDILQQNARQWHCDAYVGSNVVQRSSVYSVCLRNDLFRARSMRRSNEEAARRALCNDVVRKK